MATTRRIVARLMPHFSEKLLKLTILTKRFTVQSIPFEDIL
jgi:hypothetical protein